MYAILIPRLGRVRYLTLASLPGLEAAQQAYGKPDIIHQGGNVIYQWLGLTCDVYPGSAVWSAYRPDTELWLRLNTPDGARVLDNS